MTWDFETEPEFQTQLDWVDAFVREEVEPLDHLIAPRLGHDRPGPPEADPAAAARRCRTADCGPATSARISAAPATARSNWPCSTRSSAAPTAGPIVFGCQAPDSGNAEILAHYGTDELKKRYLEPLLDNEIVSAFSMTEPQGGSDPTGFVTTAVLDGDEWVINGEKWFSSHASFASFLIVLAVTDPDAARRIGGCRCSSCRPTRPASRSSATSGSTATPSEGTHAYMRYDDVRIPADHLLGERGEGFAVAQTRLGGGRIHHAMRTVGLVKQGVRRDVRTGPVPADQGRGTGPQAAGPGDDRRLLDPAGAVPAAGAAHRLEDRPATTTTSRSGPTSRRSRRPCPRCCTTWPPGPCRSTARSAYPTEMPFGAMVMESFHMGLADGATEVHKIALAREVLKTYKPASGLFPTTHLPALAAAARSRYDEVLAELHSEEV